MNPPEAGTTHNFSRFLPILVRKSFSRQVKACSKASWFCSVEPAARNFRRTTPTLHRRGCDVCGLPLPRRSATKAVRQIFAGVSRRNEAMADVRVQVSHLSTSRNSAKGWDYGALNLHTPPRFFSAFGSLGLFESPLIPQANCILMLLILSLPGIDPSILN